MAQTLASGVVIPAPGDRISAAGVQEMRTLGASVNTGLALTQAQTAQADLQSRARDADLADQVAGMEGMTYVGAWESGRTYRINDVVTHGGDSWARLTAGSTGEPGADPAAWGVVARRGEGGGFGELSETDVAGLYDTAQASGPGYDSGDLDITSTLAGITSGKVFLTRIGYQVWLDFQDVVLASPGSFVQWSGAIPAWGRPVRSRADLPLQGRASGDIAGPVLVDGDGMLTVYRPSGNVRGLVSWFTRQAPPA